MWSKPQTRYDSSDMEYFFSECSEFKDEHAHICKHDDVPDHIREFSDIILKYDGEIVLGNVLV